MKALPPGTTFEPRLMEGDPPIVKYGGLYGGCARCGHGQARHRTKGGRYDKSDPPKPGPCLACSCDKWWGGICPRCDEYCMRDGGMCANCYRKLAIEKELRAIANYNSPEQVAERQRKEERKWIREGHRTLTAIRRHLALPSSADRG